MSPFVDVEVGSAAPAGTVASRRCDPACTLTLTGPGTPAVDVGEKIPELQPAADEANLALATLSFDAQWIGIPDGQSYLVAHLEKDGVVLRVPDAPEGERWQPIGWTPSSGSLALARTGPDGVTGFAMVDTAPDPSFNQNEVHELPNNPLPGWQPLDNGVDSIEVARPIADVMDSRIHRGVVYISSDQAKQGDFTRSSEPLDLSRCLGPNETFRSPDGAPMLSAPPSSKSPHVDEGALEVRALPVFDRRSNSASAVIGTDCSRYDLPNAATKGRVIPRTTDSCHVVVQNGDSTRVLLVKAPGTSAKVVFESQAEVEVLLPGASASLTG